MIIELYTNLKVSKKLYKICFYLQAVRLSVGKNLRVFQPTDALKNRVAGRTRALTIPVIDENLTFDAYERIKEIY